MKFFILLKYFIYLILIGIVFSLRYPINKNLDNSTGSEDLIEIELRSVYINYTRNNNVISIFHTNFCGYCYFLIEMLKWASSYPVVSNWKFLSVNCTRKQLICKHYNITKLPTIKTYINKTELPYQAPYELIPFLEYLIKLSTPSIIEIFDNNEKKDNDINMANNNKNINSDININLNNNINITNNMSLTEFYNKLGYFSPIVEYNPNNTEFYNCIVNYANNKYKTIFYFGLKKIKNNINKERIIFDNNGAPFIFIWDGNCTNVDIFLEEHIFPLVTIITESSFFYNLNKRHKLLVMLFGFLSNNKTKKFVYNQYKHIAHEKKKFIFSFLNYTNTSEINHYFGIKLYSRSELKLVIFDFAKSMYYIHPIVYDINYNEPEEIFNDYNKILTNLSEIEFTTGYFFKDLLLKLGINEITTYVCFILISLLIIFVILFSSIFIFICKRVCPPELGDDEKTVDNNEYKNNSNNNEIKKENIKNTKLKMD